MGMSISKIILLSVLFLYVTKVVGLMIHCDNCDGLEAVRAFSYVIPLLEVAFWVYSLCALVFRWSKESYDTFKLLFKHRRDNGKLILLIMYTDLELRKEFVTLFKMFKPSNYLRRRNNRKFGRAKTALKGLFGEVDNLIDGQRTGNIRAYY